MYAAMCRRDRAFIGQFYVGVKSTGVFCRPGCPARVPKREHCEFLATPRDALLRGYRPCRRCTPLDPPAAAPRWALELVRRLGESALEPCTADDVRALGVHPSTASRYFKRHLGATLQALLRATRVGLALRALREKDMSHAIARSGFDSESGLRKACEELFGGTPKEVVRRGLAPLIARWISTPLGVMLAIACDEGLCLLEFVDRRMLMTNLRMIRHRMRRPIVAGDHAHIRQVETELREYFAGTRRSFDTPLATVGTPFQERVWRALREIPYGQTRSYSQIAAEIGRPGARRAVASANGDNRVAILIPCHRVIGADGALVGYGGGLWRKRRLLDLEREA